MTEKEKAIDDVYNAMLEANREKAKTALNEYAEKNSYKQCIQEILEPALQLFGEKWYESEEISLAHGYISGKIAEDALVKAAAEYRADIKSKEIAGIAVIGNIEDDYHSLGRKLLGTFLKSSGWEVHDLGNDVLPEEFVDKALEVGAHVIGASSMMYTTAKNISKLRDEIDKRNLNGKIQLAVGGAIFLLRPQLVNELKADGTAHNAIAAVKLFETLDKKAKKLEA